MLGPKTSILVVKWAQRQKSCRYIENCVKMELQKSRNRYAWVWRGDTFWFTSAKIINHACTIMQFSNMKSCTLTHWNKNWKYLNKKPTTSLIFRYPLSNNVTEAVVSLQWHPALLTPDSCLLFFLSTFLPGTMPHTQRREYYHTISVPSYSFAGIYGSDDIKVLYGLA